MELYHNNMSVCAQKVRYALNEKGLQPVEHHLNLRAGESHTPEYLKLNPKGVVPTIVDRGEPIIESTVICEYLDEAYPENPLRPEDPLKRAKMRKWSMIPDAGLHRACSVLTFAIAFRHQEQSRQLAALSPAERAEREKRNRLGLDAPEAPPAVLFHDKLISDMNEQLNKTEWLIGDQFTLADLALVSYMVRLEHLALEWMWEENPDRARVTEWMKKVKARRGYAGIVGKYLDPKYLEIMQPHGREARPKVEAILAAA